MTYRATVVPPGRAASGGGEPKRGSQSPPQSSSKPPDSAEKCEWLSAAMRRAGRLARRPFSPCFTLVSRTFHARSLLAIIQVRFIGEVPARIWKFTGDNYKPILPTKHCASDTATLLFVSHPKRTHPSNEAFITVAIPTSETLLARIWQCPANLPLHLT